MKKIGFLIIGILLVLGLVLPGCGPVAEEEEEEEQAVTYNFTDNTINIGIVGDIQGATGKFQYIGATAAASAINGAGGVVIGGVPCTIALETVDTKESTELTGETGYTALSAKINDFDIMMGGFRTECLTYYRDVAIDAQKMFFDAGAATEALCDSVNTDYDTYKYFFKATPYNEYFLAKSVLKMLDAVARQYRVACNMTADAQLTACILCERLGWALELYSHIEDGLPALHITLLHDTYKVSDTDSSETTAALGAIAAAYDPNFLIPIYSASCGIYFDAVRAQLLPNAMAVGINVGEQFKSTAIGLGNNLTDPTKPPAGALEVLLDTWADGVTQTSKTAAFLAAVAGLTSGDYPLYTAVTYDELFILKNCLEDVGTVVGGVPQAKADDIIAWLEDPANAQLTTTGAHVRTYPVAGTTVGGKPALTEAQVKSMYDIASYGYTYNANDWQVPPHAAHDLVYGPGSATGIGCQWQWAGTAWKKVGVWPKVEQGVNLKDQYGDWNFAYTGTVPIVLSPKAIAHFKVS